MKQFVFLYPIPEIIDFEIERKMPTFMSQEKEREVLKRLEKAKSGRKREKIKQEVLEEIRLEFRAVYGNMLNACIDARYRQKGFGINYVVFSGSTVSDVIVLQEADRVIEAKLDFKTHTTKQKDGEYLYPDPDYVLDQFNGMQVLRIGGFHIWDCVEKFARRAHERGLDVLVDEDLTELFGRRLRDSNFKIDRYPTYRPRKKPAHMFELFMEARRGKPWLWQNY